ncbi:MAG: phosphoadenosine phosphosulfate reductase family protein [Candidatus Methanomethylicaceae archaeon]
MSVVYVNELFPSSSNFDAIMNEAVNVLADALRNEERIVIAYSGGKDSNTLFDLAIQYFSDCIDKITVYSILNPLEPHELREIIYLKSQYMPILLYESKSWLDILFERGYLFPTPRLRWCTGFTKVAPTGSIKELKGKMVVGTRMHESSNRKRLFESKNYLKNNVLTPIKHWHDEHVWYYLLNVSPLKHINSKLYSIYNKAKTNRMGCMLCPLASRINYAELIELHHFVYTITKSLTDGSGYDIYCEDAGCGVYKFKRDVLEQLLVLIRQAECNCNYKLLNYQDDEAIKLYELGVQKRIERKRA